MNGAAGPRVAVVVLSYQSEEAVAACARAALASRGVRVELRIVDNASPDGSGERLAARFPGRVQVLPANTGYAGGMNTGIRWWLGGVDADFGLLLTQDVTLEPDALARLVEAVRAHPRAGVAAPLMRYPEGFPIACSAGGTIDPRRLRVTHFPAPAQAHPYEADWAEGGCLLLARAAAEAVAGFDERYFMYYEENDLCQRVRAAGWSVLVVPAATARHDTARLPGAHFFYYMSRNSVVFWREHYAVGFGRVAAAHALDTLRMALGAARAVVTPRLWKVAPHRGKAAARQLVGVVLGMRDAAAGRYGRQRY